MSITPTHKQAVLSLSHTDLDGAGCQIVLSNALPSNHVDFMNCSYNDINKYIQIIDGWCRDSQPSTIFITDLSFTNEQLDVLQVVVKNNPKFNFIFIDHHPYDEYYKTIKFPNMKFVLSQKASATKLTYLFCKANMGLTNKKLEKFVSYVNAYDIWLTNEPEFKVGLAYNEIFWNFKTKRFRHKFMDDFSLRTSDKELYSKLMKEKREIFSKHEKQGKMLSIGNKDIFLVFASDFQSHITLDYPGYKVYIILNERGKVSVRLRDGIDKKRFKEHFLAKVEKHPNVNNCGGHDGAFGISLDKVDGHEVVTFAKFMVDIISEDIIQFVNKGE